ncbi:MAG: HAMP domain-containing protein [Candidatus Binatia bacterium]
MKYRFVFLLFILAYAVFYWDQHDSLTLTELVSGDEKNSTPAGSKVSFFQAIGADKVSLASLEIEAIFYAVLGVCGALIVIRVISTARALKEERLRAAQRTYEPRGNISRPARASIESPAAPDFLSMGTESDFTDRAAEKRPVGPARSSVMPLAPSGLMDHLSHCTHGVTGKIVCTFTALVAACGLLTIALVYFTLTSSLNKHIIQRMRVTAVNVSDSAPGFLLEKNATGLREILRKHADRPELAYILVENRAGEILAHSLAVLPQEVQGRSSLGDHPADSRRTLRVGASVVEELSVPILEGRRGAVRVGIWREHVEAEINETMIPLIKLLGSVVGGGILVTVFLAWRINRPIFRLVAAAKAISSGNLDMPSPSVEDTSEFGELSRALERMRSSVKAAMIRLSR